MKTTKNKTKKASGFKRFLWILILVLGFLIPLPFVYNSCGEGSSLQFSYVLQSLEGSFSVEINKGDYYTQKKDVELELKVPEKKVEQQIIKYEMFVSDTIDCSEGEWEPYHLFKPWVLKTEEMEEKEHFVFVKFREERKDSIHYVYQDAELEDSRAETSCFQSSIFFDNKPPRLELTSYPAKKSNQSSAEFRFSVQDSSSAQTECKLNDESWEECSSVWNRNHLEEGDHTFYVKSEDLVQNTSEMSFSWHIKFKTPSIAWTEKPTDPHADLVSVIGFQISKGNFRSLSYYFGTDPNGKPGVSLMEEHSRGKMNFRVPLQTEEGRNYFKIKGIDEFGNLNSVEHSWFVDRTPPSKPQFRSSSPPHRILNSDEMSFDLLVEDNHEVADIYYTLDGGRREFCSVVPYQENQKRCQKDFRLDQGSHRISFIARDRVGNESAPLQHNWNVTFTPLLKTQFVQVLDSTVFNNVVDILFVVDDSHTMKYFQNSLAIGFDGFIDKLQNVDWRIAFTTTTMEGERTLNQKGPSGLFVPVVGFQSKYFFTSSSPPSLAVQGTQKTFRNTIKSIGTKGSHAEKGLEAVNQALQRYKDCQTSTASECTDHEKSQPNKEFFRSDAVLVVIVVSDEGGAGRMTPEDLEKRITDRFFNATKKFVFHSIITPEEIYTKIRIPGLKTCHEARDISSAFHRHFGYSDKRVSHKYLEMSQLTNGKVMNIKKTPYTSCLKDFGTSIRNLVTGFQLECELVAQRAGSPVDEPMIEHNTDPNAADNASYSRFDEPHTRSGLSLSFQNSLPVGRYKITYYCAP